MKRALFEKVSPDKDKNEDDCGSDSALGFYFVLHSDLLYVAFEGFGYVHLRSRVLLQM